MGKDFYIALCFSTFLPMAGAFATADTFTIDNPMERTKNPSSKVTFYKVKHSRVDNSRSDPQIGEEEGKASSNSKNGMKKETAQDITKEEEETVRKIIESDDIEKINGAAYLYAEDGRVEPAKRLWQASIEKALKDKDGENYLYRAKGHYGALLLNSDKSKDRETGAKYVLEAALKGERAAFLFLEFHDPKIKDYLDNPGGAMKEADAIKLLLTALEKSVAEDGPNIWTLNS